jgi:type VI secretion system secreted protein Hcp
MALDFYMQVEGTKLKFFGTCTLKGRENTIPGFAWNSQITSPRDAATGQATGKRMHSPIRVTVATGRQSPLFLQAICTNEILKSVLLNFYKPNMIGTTAGVEVNYFSIKLLNATISSMRQYGQLNKNPDLMKYAEYDDIDFTFESIEWEYKGTEGNTMANDVWGAQVA